MSDTLILVDSSDREVGYEQKEKCHKNPAPLHRAFSIFIFNRKGELLIQRRNSKKVTWGGVWSNTCCSHPRKGESLQNAAKRRLKEELGFTTDLRHLFHFTYDAAWNKEWGEHELDHVFVGEYDGEVSPSKEEVENCKWVDAEELKKDMKKNAGSYTPWFKICFERVLKEK
ncbi:MAG: isopentenyl-diphosphate Delta-isomerase [Candidatus Aenigmarchaeota archaeon]|nr:isopentenyl-diphosphate Delta-isomerase [Candidatus Aenigmarchaeota archaeon]